MNTIRKIKEYLGKNKARSLVMGASVCAVLMLVMGMRVSAAVFDSHLLPLTSGFDLGNSSRPWNNLFLDGKIGVKNTAPAYDVDITGGLRVTTTSTFSGFVAIGTTTPSVLLHLFRTAGDALTALFVENGSTGSSAVPQIGVGEDSVFKAVALRYSGSGGSGSDLSNSSSTGIVHAFLSAINGINIVASSSNAEIRLATGGQANSNLRMIITGDGKVGIGTSTPASGFHVLTVTSTFGNSGNNQAGQVQIFGGGQGSPVSGRLSFGTDGSGWNFRIAKNQAGVITDIMTITDGGLVGIGMTPGLALHVTGNIAASSWIGAGCETACSGDAYSIIYGSGVVDINPVSTYNRFYFDSNALWVGTGPPATTKFHSAEDTAGLRGAVFRNSSNATNAYGISVASGLTTGSASVCSPACRLMYFYDGDYSVLGLLTYSAGTVSYGTFTGAHYAEFKGEEADLEYGDLLVLNGKYSPRYADSPEGEPIYELVFSDKRNDEGVFGVYGGVMEPGEEDTHKTMILVHALGNSFLKVTDTNGDIEIGDYLTTSPRKRFGEKQEEEAMMDYSVAKAQDSVNWSEVAKDPKLGFKWKMIPVSLHAQ